MGDDKKQDFKKSFPNSFVWFLMAAFLMALMVQNFIETKFAKVSFSYQLEHLVNLQLIQPEDSRKTAQTDNLVTFSGRFRDRLTEEGKNRYKYLELLNSNHELLAEKERLKSDLAVQRNKIIEAADWFLHLSGQPLPKNGYVVVDVLYNTPESDNSVVITQLPNKKGDSLENLKKEFQSLKSNPTKESVNDFSKSLSELVRNLRSPLLGIGNEAVKQNLKNVDKTLDEVNNSKNETIQDKLSAYEKSLNDLQVIIDDLNQYEDHARLSKLRSVLGY